MTLFSVLLDLLPIVLIVLGAYIGMRQGFIRLVFGRLRRLTALVLALLLAKPVGMLLRDRVLLSPMTSRMKAFLTDAIGVDLSAVSAEELESQLPSALRGILHLFDVDIAEQMAEAESAGGDLLAQFAERLAAPIASLVGVCIAAVVLYFLCRLFLRAVIALLNAVFKLPGLSLANRLLGFVFGILFFALYAWIAVTVLGYLGELLSGGENGFFAGFALEETYLAKYFYSFRPIEFLFSIG